MRISPEARAVHLAVHAPPTQQTGLPTPADLGAALRAVLEAPAGPARELAAGRLATVVRELAPAFEGRINWPAGTSSSSAAVLARLLLASHPNLLVDAGRVRDLVRRLLLQAGQAPAEDASVTVVDRASAALLAAAVAATAPQPEPHSPLPFPPALLPLAAQVQPARRRRREDEDESAEDSPDEDDHDSHTETASYRSNPRRT